MRNRWVPVGLTLVVILVTVLGGFVAAGALSQPAGQPVLVGGAVTVYPLSGWQEAGTGDVGDLAGSRITRGSATLDVLTAPAGLGPEAVLVRYIERFLDPAARSLEVSQDVQEVPMNGDLTGLRVSYVGTFGDRAAEVEGQITVTVSASGTAAIFDSWAPSGMFIYSARDVHEMVRTAEVA